MNIQGYKIHRKGMRMMLNDELNKPKNKICGAKVERLEASISSCCRKIRELQRLKKEAKK